MYIYANTYMYSAPFSINIYKYIYMYGNRGTHSKIMAEQRFEKDFDVAM